MEIIDSNSLPQGVRAFIHKLVGLFDVTSNPRVVRLSTGHFAVVINQCHLVDHEELIIRLADDADYTKSLAFILDNGTDQADFFEHTRDELMKISNLIAISADLVQLMPDDYVTVGRIEQRLDDSLTAEYAIVKPESSIRDSLLHTAPTGISEISDNLSGREKWFKNRHANGD